MRVPDYITECRDYLINRGVPDTTDSVVILGSGLGDFVDFIDNAETIPYEDIPHFPTSSVAGHSGLLVHGYVSNKAIMAFSGRFHHYEGYPFSKTVIPIHIASIFSAKNLIISNAAGAVNTTFQIGDLMVIDDIIRLFHSVIPVVSSRFRYNLYSTAQKVKKIAAECRLDVQRGSYLYVKGPNYETKAEIRAFRVIGADVVGMSTAPELIEASRLDIPVAAISLITNMAAGIGNNKLDHSEVKQAAESRKDDFAMLVKELIANL